MHALAAGLLLLAGVASGAAPPQDGQGGQVGARVALVRVDGEDERLHVRLVAELRAQRYEVIEVAPAGDAGTPAPAPERELEDALRATSGAALRVESSPQLVRVWLANGLTGKQIFREVAPEENERLDRAIVALWAVELLRASAFAPRPPAASAVAAPPPAPAQAGVALEVAPAVALSPGGLGPSWHLMLGARWQLGSAGGLEAIALAPTLPARLSGTGGVALISMGLLGVGLYAATGPVRARVSAQAAAGAAVLAMRATGDATDTGVGSFVGRTDTALSGGPYLRAGVALRATGWFRVRADALSGVLFPRPVVQFADASVASWGRPWAAAVLGAEATF